MSISSEITRLQGAKNTLKTKLNAKNDSQHQITNETLEDYGDFVDSIPSGGGETLNVYTQTTEPTGKDGIWIDTATDVTYNNVEIVTDKIETTNAYTQLGDLLYNHSKGSAVAIGTDIYLFGGGSSSSTYTSAYKYNTTTGTYTQLTNIPYQHYQGSAVAVGRTIYLFGGNNSETTAYKYNTLTNTYTRLTNIPYNFLNGSAVAVGTDIYLFGSNYSSSYYKYAYKYNTITDTYTQLTDIPYKFYYGSAVAVGTDIYLFGTYYNSSYYKYAYKYNTTTDTYTQLTNIPYNFYQGCAVAIGTDVYLFGGSGSDTTAYKYNTLTNTYTQLTNIPYHFSNGSAVAVSTNIYLFSSNYTSGAYYKTAYKYKAVLILNPQSDTVYIFANGSHSANLTSKLKTPLQYAYYCGSSGLETNNDCYYGNGTSWTVIISI